MRTFLLFLILLPLFVSSQCYNRYQEEIFSAAQKTTAIPFGESIKSNGDTLSLYLDFHEPSGDVVTQRPLLVLMHGPNLVDGSKEDTDFVALVDKLAKRGFAVAAIDYRKAFSMQTLLDKNELFRATLQAAQDAKAAVRFFKANNYNVDTTMIWLGGVGAGSMAAQMAVYLDNPLEVATDWQQIIQNEGGLEGNSGNVGFSSAVRGVINLSGAILDTTWMTNNTEPLINIHGDLDDYYPYVADSLFAYTHNMICNGHHELCYKRINEVTFVQTHNSHANDSDFSILAANQNGDIPAQFAAGVRGLGIKLYYTSSFFCSGGTDLYAYHGDPIFGCVKFSTIGGQILDFLNNNPNEVLFITVEGSASNNEIANGFNAAGLTPFLYEHTFGEVWPTIGELISNNKRLIVMLADGNNVPTGYHHMWSFMQDTEYNFQSTNDFNCNYLRGNTDSDLFLLNHFLTVASPQPVSAPATNAWDLVLDRARQCGAARGLHPNLLYIDFFASGDVFRAADTLNQIGADFPFVLGSSSIQNAMLQNGILSELYTMTGQGYAPYDGNWGDSAAAFIADFMIRHFPCEMSCATPIAQIIGQDSIWKDSSYVYMVNANQGASYQWQTPDATLSGNTISFSTNDSSGVLTLAVVETSQYGCIYDTIYLPIAVFTNTSIQLIDNNTEIQVFPNPTRDFIHVSLSANIDVNTWSLYDNQGRRVLQGAIRDKQHQIDVRKLSQGAYYLHLQGKKSYSTRIVISQ